MCILSNNANVADPFSFFLFFFSCPIFPTLYDVSSAALSFSGERVPQGRVRPVLQDVFGREGQQAAQEIRRPGGYRVGRSCRPRVEVRSGRDVSLDLLLLVLHLCVQNLVSHFHVCGGCNILPDQPTRQLNIHGTVQVTPLHLYMD